MLITMTMGTKRTRMPMTTITAMRTIRPPSSRRGRRCCACPRWNDWLVRASCRR